MVAPLPVKIRRFPAKGTLVSALLKHLTQIQKMLMRRDMKGKYAGYHDQTRLEEGIICGILQYLLEHPDAKDTPEGIYKWWLSAGSENPGHEKVQEALD